MTAHLSVVAPLVIDTITADPGVAKAQAFIEKAFEIIGAEGPATRRALSELIGLWETVPYPVQDYARRTLLPDLPTDDLPF